ASGNADVGLELAHGYAQAQAPSWLSVSIAKDSKIALVIAEADLISDAASVDAWLSALDFVSRPRVAPSASPLAGCDGTPLGWADSGAFAGAGVAASRTLSVA